MFLLAKSELPQGPQINRIKRTDEETLFSRLNSTSNSLSSALTEALPQFIELPVITGIILPQIDIEALIWCF